MTIKALSLSEMYLTVRIAEEIRTLCEYATVLPVCTLPILFLIMYVDLLSVILFLYPCV
jgi:hypothetical protein